ncbi:MAG: hypothetical protein KF841_07425 [Phycisphaerae bacterium]|nr:hypothetical protein [Phycisphaerae bacterium]
MYENATVISLKGATPGARRHTAANGRHAEAAGDTFRPAVATIDRIPVWLPAMLLSVVTIWPTLGGWCSLTPDSFDYLTSARSLYESGRFPDAYLMRPPGFPVLLTPLLLFGDPPLLAIRLLLAICFIATSVLSAVLLTPMLGRRAASLVGLLVSLNGPMLLQAATCLSEMVFLPIELGVLILIDRMGRARMPRWRAHAVCGALAGVAVMVRTIGAALVPIGAIVILTNFRLPKRDRLIAILIFLLTASSMPAMWHIRQSAYADQDGYGRMWFQPRAAEQTTATGLTLQGQRLIRFGGDRLADLKRAVIPNQLLWRAFQKPWAGITTALVALIVIAVAGYRVLRYRSPTEAYLLVVLGVLSLWPWDEGVRLLVPLTPIILGVILWFGIALLSRVMPRRAWVGRSAATAILLLCVAEWTQVVASMPVMEQKSCKRMSDATRFASQLALELPESRDVACICRNGYNLKLTFLGGKYLSRRNNVRIIDFGPDQNISRLLIGYYYAVIANDLIPDLEMTANMTTIAIGPEYSIICQK